MAMALHVAADDGAVEHVEGGEQCRRAVALVVVGHGPGAALLHGQAGLGTVERLDLALLVDREDDGVGRRIDIEADDVAQFGDELRVGGELELLDPVRLKAMRAPDALNGTGAECRRPSPSWRRSSGSPRRAGRLAEGNDALGDVIAQGLDARGPRLVAQQAVIAFLHEAFLPAPDTGLRLAGPAHDLVGADTVRAQQDDLGSPDMLVGGVAILERRQTAAASAGLRVMDIPVRMRQTRTPKASRESPPGFKC